MVGRGQALGAGLGVDAGNLARIGGHVEGVDAIDFLADIVDVKGQVPPFVGRDVADTDIADDVGGLMFYRRAQDREAVLARPLAIGLEEKIA